MSGPPKTTSSEQYPTSNVLAVYLRVAGPVITDVRPHAVGTPERQVTARIGDVLIYLADPRTAAHIRQQWDASQYIAAKRLPEQAPHFRAAPDPYPLGVTVRLDGEMRIGARWVAGGSAIGTPPYLRVRVVVSCGKSAISKRGGRSETPGSTLSGISISDHARWLWTAVEAVHSQRAVAFHDAGRG